MRMKWYEWFAKQVDQLIIAVNHNTKCASQKDISYELFSVRVYNVFFFLCNKPIIVLSSKLSFVRLWGFLIKNSGKRRSLNSRKLSHTRSCMSCCCHCAVMHVKLNVPMHMCGITYLSIPKFQTLKSLETNSS